MIYKCILSDVLLTAARFLPDDEFKKLNVKLHSGDESIQLSDDGEYMYQRLLNFCNEKESKSRARMSNLKQYQNSNRKKTTVETENNNRPSEEDELSEILGKSAYEC